MFAAWAAWTPASASSITTHYKNCMEDITYEVPLQRNKKFRSVEEVDEVNFYFLDFQLPECAIT